MPKNIGSMAISAFASGLKKAFGFGSSPDKATWKDNIANIFTGNLDYQRAVAQAERAEAHSAYEAEKAREFSASEAQKNRDWQEEMSNSAYSRAIEDLRKNGINPYAIGSFNAASTPSGAVGQAYAGSGYSSSSPTSAVRSIAQSAFSALTMIAMKR